METMVRFADNYRGHLYNHKPTLYINKHIYSIEIESKVTEWDESKCKGDRKRQLKW